jgi:hypothetical protein
LNNKNYTLIFLGLVEHIAEEHGEELRRLCLVCAEAVEDSEGGRSGVEVSISFILSTEARIMYKKLEKSLLLKYKNSRNAS